MHTKGITREGGRSTATMLYSRVDENNWTIESLEDEIDGQPGPEINLRVTRRKPPADRAFGQTYASRKDPPRVATAIEIHPPDSIRIAASALAAAVLAVMFTGHSLALRNKTQPAAKGTPQGSSRTTQSPAAAAAAKAPAPRRGSTRCAQRAFLATEEWKSTASDFDQWLSTQLFYDDARTAETRARFDVGVQRMSAEQLQKFMVGLQTSFEILYSSLARDANGIWPKNGRGLGSVYQKNPRADSRRLTATRLANQSAIGCLRGASRAAAIRNSVSRITVRIAWPPTRLACNSDARRRMSECRAGTARPQAW